MKNITYNGSHNLQLDVYAPRKSKELKKVLVFVYGGNWVHGKRSTYRFFGKGMARKGVVCVVPDYRHSPATDAAGMAGDVADAVKWVKENIVAFKGDSGQVYISGHSAGGHLAALVATDPAYFEKLHLYRPLKGVILIDAFGLDMFSYLSASVNPKDTLYLPTFSTNPATWKKYSPLYYLDKNTVPFLMFGGGNTYPAVKSDDALFYKQLQRFQPQALFIPVKGKNHYRMILQFLNPHVKAYKDILSFMQAQ